MARTDAEIMGGIPVGYDQFSLSSERGFGWQDLYAPINQEPMGRNYRPDQFESSVGPRTEYEYPKWNPDDPITGIEFEKQPKYYKDRLGHIFEDNKLAVENYYQDQQMKGLLGAERITPVPILQPKDNITCPHSQITVNVSRYKGNKLIIMLILIMFIALIVVSYLQSFWIEKIENSSKSS